MRMALRFPLGLLLLSLSLVACGVGSGDEPDNPAKLIKEVIVRPGGSVVGNRYWIWDPLLIEWEELTPAQQFPRYGTMRTIVTVVAAAGSEAPDPVAPAVATADSTVVALLAGGALGGQFSSRAAVLFAAGADPEAGLEMVEARSGHTMTPLVGQRLLIVGGYAADIASTPLAAAEIFTLSSRSFAATGPMRVGRGSHAAAALADGRVLVTGGLVLDGAGPGTIDDATTELFDPASGTFSDGPDMTTARFNHSAVRLDDGRVLVLGGNHLRSAEVYSPSSNAFEAVEDMDEVHGNGHQAIKLAGGKVLVFGGDSGTIQPTATVEQFDPATNQFTTVGAMTTARMQHFAVLLDDGRILIGGGRGSDGSDLASSEIYDPATNTSAPSADMPGPTSDQPAAFITGPKPAS